MTISLYICAQVHMHAMIKQKAKVPTIAANREANQLYIALRTNFVFVLQINGFA